MTVQLSNSVPSAPLSANEVQRLAALRRYRILDTLPEDAFDDFALLAASICDTPIATMTLVDSTRQWFKAQIGLEVSETPREHAFCSHTILGTGPLIVEDTTADARFADNPFVTAAPFIRFYAGAPLIDHDGHALGALCVIDRRPRNLSAAQIQTLEILARRITAQMELRMVSSDLAVALENVKVLEGLLPICSHCKSIRDDQGYWQRMEKYLSERTATEFTHGICPGCLEQHFPDATLDLKARGLA